MRNAFVYLALTGYQPIEKWVYANSEQARRAAQACP